MYIYDALASDNYLVVDKTLMRLFGNDAALFIGELFYRRRKYLAEGSLQSDGYFYATVNSIQENINLSEYTQNKILTELENLGLVKTEKRGMPAKRFIYIDGGLFQKVLDEKSTTVCTVPEDLSHKCPNSSGYINNNIINNKDLSVLSKDNTSKSSVDRKAATVSKTSQSKLFSSPKTGKTKKQVTQKINQFISRSQREVIARDYSPELTKYLDRYFRMLAETNTLLPLESIKAQLNVLEQLPENKRVQAVRETIEHGWKSLQYVVEQLKQSRVPSFDTAKNAEHYLRPKDAPVVDIIAEAKARGEEIF